MLENISLKLIQDYDTYIIYINEGLTPIILSVINVTAITFTVSPVCLLLLIHQ